MPVTMLDAVEFSKIPSLGFVVPVVAADPTGYEAGFIYNSTSKEVKYHNGTAWVALGPAGAGGPPTGAAGGDLSGSYPNPQIAAGVIVDADVAAANKDGAAATPSLRTLGSGANQAAPGNDLRFTDSRPPSGAASGDLTGTYPSPQIAAGVIVDADVNASAAIQQSKIQNLVTDLAAKLALAGGTMTGPITLAADPAAAMQPATKQYVDNIATGLDPKQSVKGLANVNITLAGGAPNFVDGSVTLAQGDRVLVAAQTNKAEQGIYVVTTLGTGSNGTWTRATDMDSWAEVPGAYVWVEQGAANADTGWVCTSDQGGTLGTTPIYWNLFSTAANVYTAGAGMTKTGNTIDVVGDANLSVQPDIINVLSAPKWTTPRSITLTGDVTGSVASVDGSANVSIATTVAVAGTAPKFYAGNVGAGTAVVINHALNTRDVTVEVYRATTPWDSITCGVERTDVNNVTLRFATSVAANAFRVVVQGR